MDSEIENELERKYAVLDEVLDERSQRIWAAVEASSLGRGGVSAVARATGLSRTTIYQGIKELKHHETVGGSLRSQRVRTPGGGRKLLAEKDPLLISRLESLVDPVSRGDPESPLRWTCKSTRQLATALTSEGHPIGRQKVSELLADLGYSLQANRKVREGSKHIDRDAQFELAFGGGNRLDPHLHRSFSPDVSERLFLTGEFRQSGLFWAGGCRQVEVAGTDIVTQTMDHHGLVASICRDLGIAERVDKILFREDTGRVVTPGEAVVAMIINGLGFTNRRLYLIDQFFENKPIEQLIAPGLTASDLTYDTLAATLDEIHDYGDSRLYGELALDIALTHQLLGPLHHLDTTSVSVEGQYDAPDEPGTLRITHGHSKDHRPDLKQLMVSLVVTGDSHFPLWMEALDGNSSDKVNFHETIARVRAFQSQLKVSGDARWVADSALYTRDKLLQVNDYLWLSRVPETIGGARMLVEKTPSDVPWIDRGNGYKTAAFDSDFGGVKQRWLLVYSEQAYTRERATLDKRLDRMEKQCRAELKTLCARTFGCTDDAEKALKSWQKRKRFFRLVGGVEPIEKHQSRGRPKAGAEKTVVGYRLALDLQRNEEAIAIEANKKGRFILATNDLDAEGYPDDRMLGEYKDQQAVEKGFRFLKDPWFMLDSVFLKKPSRVSALMMVMTLCLMVYNVAEYRLRESLKRNDGTLPNQKGKAVTNPTVRWVFQLMEGINIIHFMDERGEVDRSLITNIDALRTKILHLFGQTACKMYGLIP